jgi:hypothetical protein
MGNIELSISFPLDEGYFRRECPFCIREFKVRIEEDELNTLAQQGIQSYLVDAPSDSEPNDDSEEEPRVCPYCGERAGARSWWTHEQLAYMHIFAKNIAARMINENLIKPLQRDLGGQRSGLISVKFTGREIEEEEPWISPEVDDMAVFNLICCERSIKIDESWARTVHCFYCGFPHTPLK